MELKNKLKAGLLLSCMALVLTGCKKKKKEGSVDYSEVQSKKKKGKKRWDPNLEAYVFEGEDSQALLAENTVSKDFQKIYFDYDRRDIRDDQRPAVDYDIHLAKAVVQDVNALTVIGKSDTQCISEVYNTAVSQGRADQMAKEFTLAGIPHEKVIALGVGDTQLEVPVHGKEPLNRCVLVNVG